MIDVQPQVPGFAQNRSVSGIMAAPRYVPDRPWRYIKLYDELRAAGVWFDYAGQDGFVFAPDAILSNDELLAVVAQIVAAHDPNVLTPTEVAAQASQTDATNFDQQYDQAITDLTAFVNGSGTLSTAQLTNAVRREAAILLKLLPLARRLRNRQI